MISPRGKALAAAPVRQFGLIVLDPPSFTRNRASVPDALRGYKEIHLRALKLLKTDHFDLYQMHHLVKPEDVKTALGPGGALEAALEAREKGWVRFIGVTGHHDPAVLRAALERYEFDTVLLPVNPAEPAHASFLPLAREALAEAGATVITASRAAFSMLPLSGQAAVVSTRAIRSTRIRVWRLRRFHMGLTRLLQVRRGRPGLPP